MKSKKKVKKISKKYRNYIIPAVGLLGLGTIGLGFKYLSSRPKLEEIGKTANSTTTESDDIYYKIKKNQNPLYPHTHINELILSNISRLTIKPMTELNIINVGIKSINGGNFPDTLTHINLSNNMIASINRVNFPRSLRYLNISHNIITSLENVKFPDLYHLDLTGNMIKYMNNVNLPRTLERLDISNNMLGSLADIDFSSLLFLRTLSLNDNNITTLYGIKFPESLRILSLSRNKIKSINNADPNLFKLRNLSLDLSYNNIISIDCSNFFSDHKILQLSLKGNSIEGINPEQIENVLYPAEIEQLCLEMRNYKRELAIKTGMRNGLSPDMRKMVGSYLFSRTAKKIRKNCKSQKKKNI